MGTITAYIFGILFRSDITVCASELPRHSDTQKLDAPADTFGPVEQFEQFWQPPCVRCAGIAKCCCILRTRHFFLVILTGHGNLLFVQNYNLYPSQNIRISDAFNV